MQITKVYLASLYLKYSKAFKLTLAACSPYYPTLSMLQVMRIEDGKPALSLPHYNYNYYFNVPRNVIEEGRAELFGLPRVEEIAVRAASFPDEVLGNLLMSGFVKSAPDGKPQFSNQHERIKNLVIGKLSVSTLNEALSKLHGFVNHLGVVQGLAANSTIYLLVGPDNFFVARDLLNDCRELQRLTLLVSAHVDMDAWFVMAVGDQYARPFVYQYALPPYLQDDNMTVDGLIKANDMFVWRTKGTIGMQIDAYWRMVGSRG